MHEFHKIEKLHLKPFPITSSYDFSEIREREVEIFRILDALHRVVCKCDTFLRFVVSRKLRILRSIYTHIGEMQLLRNQSGYVAMAILNLHK